MRRVVAALLVLAACSGGGEAPSSTTTAPGSLPYYLPSFLPFGFRIVKGGLLDAGPPQPALAIALGRPAAEEGAYTGVILVLLRAASADREVDPNQGAVTPIDINGTQARLLESGIVGVNVDWFANGVAVAILGPIGSKATVVDVAKRVRVGAAVHDASLTEPPAGYSVIEQTRFADRVPERAQSLSIATEKGAALSMSVTQTSLPLVFVASGGDTIRPVTVRSGKKAIISSRVRQLESGPVVQSTVAWHERDGVAISISGNASHESILPIVEGIATVTESEWKSVVPA